MAMILAKAARERPERKFKLNRSDSESMKSHSMSTIDLLLPRDAAPDDSLESRTASGRGCFVGGCAGLCGMVI